MLLDFSDKNMKIMEYLIQTKPDHLFYLLEKILKDYYENIIYEKDKYFTQL